MSGELDSGGSGGQGDDDPVTFSDFTHPDSETLLGRVDFLGIIGTFAKTTWVAFLSFFTALMIAAWESFEQVLDASMQNATGVTNAITGVLDEAASTAAQAASGQVNAFGIFSLPAGAVSVLAAMFVVTVILYVFVWGET